jgi:hypothetical protein
MDRGTAFLILIGLYITFMISYFIDLMVFIRRSTSFKLSSSTGIITTTQSYNENDTRITYSQPSSYINLTHLPNDIFLQTVNFRRDFLYNDTQQVEQIDPNITCLPKLFGYSEAEGNRIFPEYFYPDCKDVTRGPFPELYLDYENNKFSMKCTEGKPHYLIDPDVNRRKSYQKHELLSKYELKDYKGDVDLKKGEEFVYGGCSADGTLNNAVYIPRRNDTIYKIAKNRIKIHQQTSGIFHKPQILFILTIDSFSRPHFFRKLPNTVKYLNKLNKNLDFAVFDMKLHNILGATSVDNTLPIFSSKIYLDLPLYEFPTPPDRDVLGDTALWNIYYL